MVDLAICPFPFEKPSACWGVALCDTINIMRVISPVNKKEGYAPQKIPREIKLRKLFGLGLQPRFGSYGFALVGGLKITEGLQGANFPGLRKGAEHPSGLSDIWIAWRRPSHGQPARITFKSFS